MRLAARASSVWLTDAECSLLALLCDAQADRHAAGLVGQQCFAELSVGTLKVCVFATPMAAPMGQCLHNSWVASYLACRHSMQSPPADDQAERAPSSSDNDD